MFPLIKKNNKEGVARCIIQRESRPAIRNTCPLKSGWTTAPIISNQEAPTACGELRKGFVCPEKLAKPNPAAAKRQQI